MGLRQERTPPAGELTSTRNLGIEPCPRTPISGMGPAFQAQPSAQAALASVFAPSLQHSAPAPCS
eukprot:2986370-Pyramimonas_sp.AAC.1